MKEYEMVRKDVASLLESDKSGHGMEHVDRVYNLSLELARQENADLDVVALAAYLHDVDDYKLFGRESAEKLTNANAILRKNNIEQELGRRVLEIIPAMGYNNFLEGKRPESLEGQIVSDADMNDAIGSQGLIRVFEYNASKGRPFFVKSIPPQREELTAEQYRSIGNDHAVQHFFDKLLKIPGILMTESGRIEGEKRAQIMIDYLYELFREEDADDWMAHLDEFTTQNSGK